MPNGEIRCPKNNFKIYDSFSDIFIYYFGKYPPQPNIVNTVQGVQSRLDKNPNCKIEIVHEWNQEMAPGYEEKGFLWKIEK